MLCDKCLIRLQAYIICVIPEVIYRESISLFVRFLLRECRNGGVAGIAFLKGRITIAHPTYTSVLRGYLLSNKKTQLNF